MLCYKEWFILLIFPFKRIAWLCVLVCLFWLLGDSHRNMLNFLKSTMSLLSFQRVESKKKGTSFLFVAACFIICGMYARLTRAFSSQCQCNSARQMGCDCIWKLSTHNSSQPYLKLLLVLRGKKLLFWSFLATSLKMSLKCFMVRHGTLLCMETVPAFLKQTGSWPDQPVSANDVLSPYWTEQGKGKKKSVTQQELGLIRLLLKLGSFPWTSRQMAAKWPFWGQWQAERRDEGNLPNGWWHLTEMRVSRRVSLAGSATAPLIRSALGVLSWLVLRESCGHLAKFDLWRDFWTLNCCCTYWCSMTMP